MPLLAKEKLTTFSRSESVCTNTKVALGQRVRVTSGALVGLQGEVVSQRSENRLLVAVRFLEKTVWLSLQAVQVETA